MVNEKQTANNKAQKFQNRLARKQPLTKHDPKVDNALIVAYVNGDEEAGWELFESYADIASIVYKFPSKPPYKTAAMSKLHYAPLSPEDKEDLFQEIAFHFFKLVGEFDPELKKPFEHMVRAKLHQRVFNQYFSEYISVETNETEFDEELDFEAAAHEIVLDESMTQSLPSEHIELYQALNQLSEKQREIVIMSVVKGWNATEIGKELGIKSNAARQQLFKAMNKLRSILKPEEETV